MSLINAFANCCCDPIGHCCCSNFNDEQNCSGCLDDKTKAQCEAISGCRWVAGTCAENPCLGACCTTDESDCFVDCVSGVTECECFFEHQTAENNAVFTAGASVTCAQIGCPCIGTLDCAWIQVIKFTNNFYAERKACPSGGDCFTSITYEEVFYDYINQNEDGTPCAIFTASELIAMWEASSGNSSGGCDETYPYAYMAYSVRTANLDVLIPPTGCIGAAPIFIGNEGFLTVSKVFTCTSGCNFYWCNYLTGIVTSAPLYISAEYSNVCDQIGCTHQCEPCEECP